MGVPLGVREELFVCYCTIRRRVNVLRVMRGSLMLEVCFGETKQQERLGAEIRDQVD